MELMNAKDELKFVITDGEQSVMIYGAPKMQMWFVDNWDFRTQVDTS